MKSLKHSAGKKNAPTISHPSPFRWRYLLGFALIFAAIGGYSIWQSFAANPLLPGDINNDNKVDSADLSILLSNFGTTNAVADLNNDAKVNIFDLSILLSNYGRSISGVPTVTLSASPTSVPSGSASTLTWSSTNATSCSASGAWSGAKAISGSQSTGALTSTSTYSLTCSGSGGSASTSATVTVTTAVNEIATEADCPNQSNSSDSVAVQNTAMICMTNYARNANSRGPVAQNTALMNASAAKVNDIISCNEFSHTACGRPFDYWIKFYGYSGLCYAENIAQGYQTVRSTFIAWMNSPGHRANILNSSYRDIGVGVGGSSSQRTWVMQPGGC